MDFQSFEEKRKAFKARCDKTIADLGEILEIETNQGAKPLIKEEIKTIIVNRLWDIYKRNLSGTFNKPIVIGCTKEEAINEYNRLITLEQKKRKAVCDSHEEDVRMGVLPVSKIHKDVFYFDIIPNDATKEERSRYYNTKPVIIDEIL